MIIALIDLQQEKCNILARTMEKILASLVQEFHARLVQVHALQDLACCQFLH